MSIKLQLPKLTDLKPRITVIGIGGAGCNAINNMIASGLSGVDFVVANTDAQALAASTADHRLQLGTNLTEGLGAGSKPEIGEAAAEEAIDDIRAQVAGSHMVFIAAGMGGGTGTGAAAVIARVAKELGVLTVGIVTKPFHFEGARRMRVAEAGVAEIRKHVDTLIVIPNQNLFRVANEKTTFAEAFLLADQVLYSGVACIVDLIIKEGLINLDFADVRTVMSGMGSAVMGTGEASGANRASIAAEEAIANPLLDDVSLNGAKGLLLSITGGRDMTLYEVDEAASRVREEVDSEANIIVGATFDEKLGDSVRVSIVASGMARTMDVSQMAFPSRGARPRADAGAPMSQDGYTQDSIPGSDVDDIQRRLTEAIGSDGDADDFAVSAMEGELSESHEGGLAQSWNAPGDVVIEEGPSHLKRLLHPAPPRGDEGGHAAGNRASEFAPAPPAEIRRAGRRMPQVEDFPAVGQREYRAKVGYDAGHSGGSNAPVEQKPQRRGLLQRFLGRSRRTDEVEVSNTAEVRQEPEYRPAPPHQHQEPQKRFPNRPGAASAGPGRAAQAVEQEQPLPVFFNRERK